MVPLAGLEPARLLHRGILSPLRLPVPPQRHENENYYITINSSSQEFCLCFDNYFKLIYYFSFLLSLVKFVA